jgi:hypothetical protein
MALLDDLFSDIKTTLAKVLGADIFTNPFGSQVSYRYPKDDTAKYENVIKFTALARVKKSKFLDLRVPELALSPLGSVTLYMPAGVNVNDNLSYDNADTGIGGMAVNAAGASANTGEFLDKIKDNAKPIAQRVAASKLADFSQEKGMVGGAAGQALINSGEVVNPHTQMLFKSPSLRQFTYSFKMIPRSQAEAREIIKIVQFFRIAAYPEVGAGAAESAEGKPQIASLEMATFKFPDIFDITYLSRGKKNKNMIQQMQSYLTAVNVTYNANSPTFYADGMPSEVDLQLTFQESKALNRALIMKGY